MFFISCCILGRPDIVQQCPFVTLEGYYTTWLVNTDKNGWQWITLNWEINAAQVRQYGWLASTLPPAESKWLGVIQNVQIPKKLQYCPNSKKASQVGLSLRTLHEFNAKNKSNATIQVTCTCSFLEHLFYTILLRRMLPWTSGIQCRQVTQTTNMELHV